MQAVEFQKYDTACLVLNGKELACGACCDFDVCCYVYFCCCCAAGDVASAAGQSYCMSCCLVPLFCPCFFPCVRGCDRQALAGAHGISDGVGCCMACWITTQGMGGYLLCQEIKTIWKQKLESGGAKTLTTTTVVAVQPAAQRQYDGPGAPYQRQPPAYAPPQPRYPQPQEQQQQQQYPGPAQPVAQPAQYPPMYPSPQPQPAQAPASFLPLQYPEGYKEL